MFWFHRVKHCHHHGDTPFLSTRQHAHTRTHIHKHPNRTPLPIGTCQQQQHGTPGVCLLETQAVVASFIGLLAYSTSASGLSTVCFEHAPKGCPNLELCCNDQAPFCFLLNTGEVFGDGTLIMTFLEWYSPTPWRTTRMTLICTPLNTIAYASLLMMGTQSINV